MKTILFACVHNAGRSQMAAAFCNALADETRARAESAGTSPGARVHPEVVAVMHEVGLDLSSLTPRMLDAATAQRASVLITMGCGEACPHVTGLRREDWPLPDPKGRPLDEVRAIRDEVRARVHEFLRAEGLARSTTLHA
ncbi:MAG: arsenate reductase ArsC [Planctomycetota bacterium]